MPRAWGEVLKAMPGGRGVPPPGPQQPATPGQPIHAGFDFEAPGSPLSHCRARDPARCPYHSQHASGLNPSEVHRKRIDELSEHLENVDAHVRMQIQQGKKPDWLTKRRLQQLEEARDALKREGERPSSVSPDGGIDDLGHERFTTARDAIHGAAIESKNPGMAGFQAYGKADARRGGKNGQDGQDGEGRRGRGGDRAYPTFVGSRVGQRIIPFAQTVALGYRGGTLAMSPFGAAHLAGAYFQYGVGRMHEALNRKRTSRIGATQGYGYMQGERVAAATEDALREDRDRFAQTIAAMRAVRGGAPAAPGGL